MRPVTLYRAGGMRFAVACSRRTLTESAPFLQVEERGTTHLRRAGGLLLGILTKERGDFLSGGQADDQAAAQHRVDLAI